MIAGLDDAGRGPVIGPMVLAIAEVDDETKLAGATDSKALTAVQRERLYDTITKECKHEIIIIPAKEIDEVLSSPDSNLNWLEADKMAIIINKLKPTKVIVDSPSNNLEEFHKYLKKKLNVDCELIVKHKADQDHVIVGAASILAKVTRDREIQKIKDEYNIEFGSGYPSDPITVKFLKENWDKYPIFRKSWATWKKVAAEQGQSKLGEF